MKLVIIEPLGVNDEKLLSMAKDMLPQTWRSYITIPASLIRRFSSSNGAMMRTSSPYPIFP